MLRLSWRLQRGSESGAARCMLWHSQQQLPLPGQDGKPGRHAAPPAPCQPGPISARTCCSKHPLASVRQSAEALHGAAREYCSRTGGWLACCSGFAPRRLACLASTAPCTAVSLPLPPAGRPFVLVIDSADRLSRRHAAAACPAPAAGVLAVAASCMAARRPPPHAMPMPRRAMLMPRNWHATPRHATPTSGSASSPCVAAASS